MTLDELFHKHGSDKGTGGHNYTEVYQRYFKPLKDEPIRLLCGEEY